MQTTLIQHLIDPAVCIRCNTCEATCPIGAITHDDRNYVVDASICNGCKACVPPCPTGSIDHWFTVNADTPFSLADQLVWDDLPEPQVIQVGEAALESATQETTTQATEQAAAQTEPIVSFSLSSIIAPASASAPSIMLHKPSNPITAKVVGNLRITDKDAASDTHHVVLDFGSQLFPVLEGQSIAVVPTGTDAKGRAHFARQYSIASPRDGERAGFNNLSITVKRVVDEYEGKPYRGVASNYVCDLAVGNTVQVLGPFGKTFLMPNDTDTNVLMICTGTGSAPMRGMTERARRLVALGQEQPNLMLFFGARTQGELPYFGPLTKLPKSLIDVNLAFSRVPNEPKKYVQDSMRERAADVAAWLQSDKTYIYVCGLKSMEAGVIEALADICRGAGLDWVAISAAMRDQGRLHLETY